MKTTLLPLFATLLAIVSVVPSSLTAQEEKAAGADVAQHRDLRRAFLGFYLSIGPARAAIDPAEVVKAGAASWHLPDEKARQSLDDFGAWVLVAKPTDIAVEKLQTAGDLARMTIQFAHVEAPHPSRAEVTLLRAGRNWKMVNIDLQKVEAATVADSPDATLPAPAGDSARETLENYLKMLAGLATNPEAQATAENPQKLADELAEWWVDNRERSQMRAMTQGAMFFRLYQSKEWAIDPAGSASPTSANFSVKVQPGNEVARRLGPKTLTFGLVHSNATGWKISRYINPQLVPGK